MWTAAMEAMQDFRTDKSVRVVVVTGAGGKAFASGADISKFKDERTEAAAVAHYQATTQKAYDTVLGMPIPTIAMIRGYCIGGGTALAVCCDMRICTENSKFGVPAAKLGLGYGMNRAKPLVDLVGPAYAKEMFFTGRQFTAQEAEKMGLVKPRGAGRPARRGDQGDDGNHRRQRPANGEVREAGGGRSAEGCRQARRRGHRARRRGLLQERRLQGRPGRLHGEAQAEIHRARKLLLVLVDLGVVGVARELLLRARQCFSVSFRNGVLHAQPARQLRSDAHVLRHQRKLEARGVGAGQDVLRDLAHRGAVPAGGGVDRGDHRLRVEAEALRDQQRLESGERSRRPRDSC
jgi:enoyl-CoA hydratase/carnithine racemase